MSTGDRTILGRISKRGNGYLRMLFMQAARVATAGKLAEARLRGLARSRRSAPPSQRFGPALANKLARIAWTVLAQERSYETRLTKAAA